MHTQECSLCSSTSCFNSQKTGIKIISICELLTDRCTRKMGIKLLCFQGYNYIMVTQTFTSTDMKTENPHPCCNTWVILGVLIICVMPDSFYTWALSQKLHQQQWKEARRDVGTICGGKCNWGEGRLLRKKEEWGLTWKWRAAGGKRCKDIIGGLILRLDSASGALQNLSWGTSTRAGGWA